MNYIVMFGGSSSIFRSYDVRGIVGKDLDSGILKRIGTALGNYIKEDIVVAHDARIHSIELKKAFEKGFMSSGFSLEDCGLLTLGAGMFHAWQTGKSFAYITGSHLPKEWNGIKFFHSNGLGFIEKENMKVRDLFLKGPSEKTPGKRSTFEASRVLKNYSDFLNSKIKISRKLDIVLDCGNGCAGLIAPQMFKEAGCNVTTIFSELDGSFPNHAPDPIETELSVLKQKVIGKDFGIAYDGDGDRTAIIDEKGNFMSVEETSFIILSELLKHEKGPVIANVECTRMIDTIASKFNRKLIRVPVGHTFLMQGVNEHKASFGVERSGHFCIPAFIPFDDSIIVGFFLASVVAKTGKKMSELKEAIPKVYFERISYQCPDEIKFVVMKNIAKRLKKDFENINDLDGIRVDLDNGWGLIRVSNTGPVIRLTVEGVTESDKVKMGKLFSGYLSEEMKKRDLDLVEVYT